MVATWAAAAQRYGKRSFADDLQPAVDVARLGFTITPNFVQEQQVALPDLQAFTSSRELFLTPTASRCPSVRH